MPNLNTEIMSALPFVLPPLNEQQAIAEILGSLDDKIELNRRMNETLEGMARAIFKSRFVDFDPVRAKAAGRRSPGMDRDTAALFPDRFQDSPLGKVPKGWAVASLGEHADATKGLSYKGSGLATAGIPNAQPQLGLRGWWLQVRGHQVLQRGVPGPAHHPPRRRDRDQTRSRARPLRHRIPGHCPPVLRAGGDFSATISTGFGRYPVPRSRQGSSTAC